MIIVCKINNYSGKFRKFPQKCRKILNIYYTGTPCNFYLHFSEYLWNISHSDFSDPTLIYLSKFSNGNIRKVWPRLAIKRYHYRWLHCWFGTDLTHCSCISIPGIELVNVCLEAIRNFHEIENTKQKTFLWSTNKVFMLGK